MVATKGDVRQWTGLEFWDRVEKTDPAFTTPVNERGGFTSIDSYYRIKRATEEWGPIGGTWWAEIHEQVIDTPSGPLFLARCELHHPMGEHAVTGFSAWPLSYSTKDGRQRSDSDAPKKAATGALSKALSLLGFSADVHLGMFDDAEYVEQLKVDSAPRASEAMIETIRNLAISLHGDKSEAYVAKTVKQLGFTEISQLPSSTGERWAKTLEGRLAAKEEG